ncbi:chloramphenicol-sensitive protein RarD [Ardenticatena maritima]|uniref:Chloramphenicol-sensitive protein RarD n=1 Tax=Ardenticatena maritima TaxID=872965 RepID=A0A0M8K8V9_9CHLR|nr:EamA family transporter RarD [Ardenticatena maritima]KPL88538.1 hypothetical protein SE16_07120 [Ardenticatena maritima]GAP63211.1 chloramphenicol-sensitive protein RarD [Ardenticatena maritima]
MRSDRKGIVYAFLAYVLWGLFPLYWKQLDGVPATQLIGHRIIWSFIFLVALFALRGQLAHLHTLLRNRRIVLIYGGAAVLIALNWLIFVWAVNAGYIVETSLGYFINPLLSVLLGMLVLKEQLRGWQWVAIGLATLGVGYLTLSYGRLPWIALALAGSFGVYGLVTKIAPLDALDGLTLETGLLFIPALAFLLLEESAGRGAFGHAGLVATLFMAGTGVVTAVPLLLFGAAARRIPLSTVGILQYLAPTLQFLIGVLIYAELFHRQHLIGYSCVWLALAIFWLEGWYTARRGALAAAQ